MLIEYLTAYYRASGKLINVILALTHRWHEFFKEFIGAEIA